MDNERTEDQNDQNKNFQQEKEEPNFSSMSKEDLVSFMEDHADVENPLDYNRQVVDAKAIMENILEKEYNEALEKFLEEGNERIDFVPANDELKNRFFKAFNKFRDKKKQIIDERNKKLEANLKVKENIINELKSYTEADLMAPNLKKVRELQDKWKETGPVPAANAENINRTYHFYLKKFFNNLNVYGEFIELDKKKNLEIKETLCKKAEALIQQNDIENARHIMLRYEDDWKKTGPVPRENVQEIETRFRNAVTNFYSYLETTREKEQQEKEDNFKKKEAILEKIEELPQFDSDNIKEWLDKENEMKELIDKFQSTGFAPAHKYKKQKERFNKAIKEFNNKKNLFFKQHKKEKAENLEKKKALLDEVESILKKENIVEFKDRVIKIQKEWKNIGHIPKNKLKSINNNFFDACNKFFERLTEENKSLEKEFDSNIKEREQFIKNIKDFDAPASLEEAKEKVQQLRQEWNNLGEIPEKVQFPLNKKFTKALKSLLKPVTSENSNEADIFLYEIEMENILNEDNAEDKLDREVKRLNRLDKDINEEFTTLKNNLGMFSTNEGLPGQMKQEYEDRIKKLEKDLEIIREKLKFVRRLEKKVDQ